MTELEHVEIEGFKGLEYVEFEPTDINLITGRNNTGKTSFLEAIDLVFNPANLQAFGDNLDSVIHTNYDSSTIYWEENGSESKIRIREPSAAEAGKYFSDLVPRIGGYQMSLSSFTERTEQDESKYNSELHDRIQNLTTEVLEDALTQESMTSLRKEILLFSTSTEVYPYFLGGEESISIMEDILEEVKRELEQEKGVNSIDTYYGRGNLTSHIDTESGSMKIGLPPKNRFLEQPKTDKSAEFIKSTNLTGNIERTSDEQEPIKIDDIGDFLTQKGFTENLKTFTLDYLVFEEDGKKKQIPYDFMGDGLKSIVGLLWELMDDDVENEIVLLEEPETHMHPGYVREVVYFLIDLARKEDVQLFITTHDSDFINDFFTENLTDEEEAYLEDEFSLLRMEEDGAVVEDYDTARENLKDLHLDLRGI